MDQEMVIVNLKARLLGLKVTALPDGRIQFDTSRKPFCRCQDGREAMEFLDEMIEELRKGGDFHAAEILV